MTSSNSDWANPITEIRGTRFEIRKLLPVDAFKFFNRMSNQAADALGDFQWDSTDLEDEVSTMLAVTKIVLKLPAELWDDAAETLLRRTFFTNASHKTPTPVAANMEAAFDGLEGCHIHEVVVRSFLGTFSTWLPELKSRLPAQITQAFTESQPAT